MRKLIVSIFTLTLLTGALYFTKRSQAAVTTTIAPAGTPLSTQSGPLWKYPNSATNCSRSFNEPYASYTIDIATTGDYTFTMNTSGFTGSIYIYRSLFVATAPCSNIVNGQDADHDYMTGNPLAFTLSASNPGRYVVVFTTKNIVDCPNCPNQNTHSSHVNGTFSAEVSGPAAVTLVQNVTSTIAGANTPLNSQNNYTWKYPLKTDCSSLSGTVPFAAYKVDVATTGSYTFTMNTSGFAGVIHAYASFNPGEPCSSISNSDDGVGNIITGNSITIPVSTFGSAARLTLLFSAQNPGEGGAFSASVTGPGAVTVVPPGDLAIASQPISKSVSKGCQQTLTVYVTGPTPQTFQWYEGVSGNLSTSIILPGANANTFITPALDGDKSYWVRVTSGSDHVDSDTIKFKVYAGTNTPFKGSLDTIQTWNLRTTSCNQAGPSVHYRAIHFRIPVSGQYKVHLNSHTFPGQYAITEYDSLSVFDATQPCLNFGGGVTNTDLNNHFIGGQDVIFVISATTSGALGDFDGYISSNDSCTLPETIEDALIISGNPLDQAVTPGNSATLTFAYSGGSNGNKSIQWYKGASGDISQPISGATAPTYVTPPLSQTNNETTYYYYWARVDDPDSFTHADTGSAVVSVITPPITYSDVLTTCDEQYAQVSGPVTYYKIFPFKVSVNGSYTFSISANGFTPFVALYQGFFSSTYPNINYYGPGGTQTLLASPNNYYLVITTTGAGQTGSFTLNINGPALVVPSLRPEIKTQPTDKIVFRNQTATLSVATNSPVVSYQWYTGTCSNKTPVSGGNESSYTTPPMTDYKDYWVKVSYGVMFVNSQVAHVRIKPQAVSDGYIIDEDMPLNVAASGVLANDKKADSKTLTASKVTDPVLGTRTLNGDGSLSYTPTANVNGPDVFQYMVSDGILESDPENVAILVRAINDPPVMTGGSLNNHTFNEDSAGGILHLGGVSYGPGGGADEASQQLTYKVTAVPPASLGNVLLANNTTVVTANTTYTLTQIQGMQFKPAANGYGGPYPFTFTVTDNGESFTGPDPKSITQSLNITVNAVADAPTVTSATTNEDTPTTSGLVIDRNAADGAEVGYFKIGLIKGGTVYKNDGTTQINNDQFITYAEAHAGLKFKPNANAFSTTTIFSFEVRASLTNSMQGLGDTVTATITVNPVAELPSVTSAATFVNLQTASGLVVTRNPLDGPEIGYYKISAITNGTLYKSDGTQISQGQFITVAEGSAGLRFTPDQDSMATGSFSVQGSADTSGNGLGPAANANITVSKYATTTNIISDSPAPSYLDQEITVDYSVVNTSGAPVPSGDVVVTVSGGAETCTGTVAAGSCKLTLNSGGNPRTITATYSGNNQFGNSSGTKDHIVNACTQNTVVTSVADDGTAGTLRYIVANACEGSTITFDPGVFDPANAPYIISLVNFSSVTSELLIDKNLTIIGPGAGMLTVRRSTQSRTQHFRIFNIASGATVTISGLTISNGFANGGVNPNDADGGGILNAGTLTLNACAVSGNQAGRTGLSSASGGGIYSTGVLTIINSTVSGNNAFISQGGGVFIKNSATANIINSTISGNTAASSGGGLAVLGTANLFNATITNNTASLSGGGVYNEGTTTSGNSIVAGNASATGPDVLLNSGTINTSGHNLIGRNDGAELVFLSGSNVNNDIVGTPGSPVPALLDALADNGGTTQTHLPLAGSPALDAGSNANVPADTFDVNGNNNATEPLPLDQRGQARITNPTVDIGAVEVNYSITATDGAAQSVVINNLFVTPLKASATESGKPKSGASVTFTAPANGAGGTFSGNLSATVTTDINGVATAPAFTANGIAGNYNVIASLGDGTPSASFSLTNTQGLAQIILGGLTQTYDGAPKNAAVTTVPSGLPVTLTYDGSATPPINAGAYQVAAIISDPNYAGQAAATLNISKANQTINFGALPNKTVGDTPFALNANASSGLTVSFNLVSGPASISGNLLTLTGSGTVLVRASQAGDGNHNPAASVDQSFQVNKIQATLTFGNLTQAYDGTARSATVTTNPANLGAVTVRYSQNGMTVTSPTNAGSYDVVASLTNDIYEAAEISGTLTIARANQTISFDPLPDKVFGDSDFALSATASSALSVTFSAAGTCLVSGSKVQLTGAGTCTVTASQPGNANYDAASSVNQFFNISKGAATVALGNLSQSYDGAARKVTVVTNPAGLNVGVTYNGSATAPTNAGSYAVVGTINDANYQGSVTDQLVVGKLTPIITWSNPSDITYGVALSATQLNATSSVAGGFSYTPAAGVVLNAGTNQTLTVNFTPTDTTNYNAASGNVALNVSKASQTVSFGPVPNKTYGDAEFGLNASASSGLGITFTVLSGPASISGNVVSLTGPGTVTIRAAQSGDSNYNAAASVDQSFTVSKANQTITFASLPNKTYGDPAFALNASASSGLGISFSVLSGPASISGNTVNLTGAGTVTIRATQTGDSNYNAAVSVDQSFTVSKANQTITFASLPNKTYGDADFVLNASASSGVGITLSVLSGPATISGTTVRLTGAGTVTVRAAQAGDGNYNAAVSVEESFTVSKANQSITFAPLPNKTYGDTDFALNASASSGLAISFSVLSGPASISGNKVNLTGAGTVTIRATQTGDSNYNAAVSVEQSFTVSSTNQTITFAPLPNKTYGDADFSVNATASSNLPVSFTVTGNCLVTGATVRISGAGQCTVTAAQVGNSDYSAAVSVDQTFPITQAATTTTLTSSLNPADPGQIVTLTAAVTSTAGTPTGTVQFRQDDISLGDPVALNESGLASFSTATLATGSHTITVDYNPDANFATSNGTLSGGQVVNGKAPLISFSLTNYDVDEGNGFVRLTINRAGDTGAVIDVDYATDDTGSPADCGAPGGLASARCDFTPMFGTLTFAANQTQQTLDIPINRDSYSEGPELFTLNLSNLTGGASFATPASATVTINDSESLSPNAIDDTKNFVRQQYHDFLNREPDAKGLAFWAQNIDKCNDAAQRQPGQTLAECTELQRIVTSAAFFLSIEFKQTGGLVRDFYVAALDRPATKNMPSFVEFERDTQRIQRGMVVGQGDWQQTLNDNRLAFIKDFVMRSEFTGLYPTTDTPTQYVDKIYLHAAVTPKSPQERIEAIAEFGTSATAADAQARGRALLRITQSESFQAREINPSFVQLEYCGYLRRNPNDGPDQSYAGYDFWTNKLNQFSGDFLQAEMVKAFLSSDEYRRRFGK